MIESGDTNIILIFLYTAFSFLIIILIVIIFCSIKQDKGLVKNSALVTYSMKILNFFAIAITTIFTLPFYNIFFSVIVCYNDSPISKNFQCYEGTYYIHFTVALIGLFLLVVFSVIFTMLYIDLNPCSQLPFAGPQSYLNQFRLIIKIVIPLWFIIDYKGKYHLFFCYLILVAYFLQLFIRIRSTEMYNKQINKLFVTCDTILLWITFCGCLHAVRFFSNLFLIF